MKRQTLILVVIGVILFIAGSAIAYASVQGASKTRNRNTGGTGRAPRPLWPRRTSRQAPRAKR